MYCRVERLLRKKFDTLFCQIVLRHQFQNVLPNCFKTPIPKFHFELLFVVPQIISTITLNWAKKLLPFILDSERDFWKTDQINKEHVLVAFHQLVFVKGDRLSDRQLLYLQHLKKIQQCLK